MRIDHGLKLEGDKLIITLPLEDGKKPSDVVVNGKIYAPQEKAQLSEEDATKDATSDLINRQEAIDAILNLTNCDTVEGLRAYVIEHDLGSWWSGGVLSSVGKVERLPSAEPKTPSNGSITCVKSEKMHVRPTDDLISREDTCEAVKNEMESWLEGDRCDYRNVVDAIMDLPSAEGCKCPCEYREPCDVCHYDGHLGMGCPAEEGLKDE